MRMQETKPRWTYSVALVQHAIHHGEGMPRSEGLEHACMHCADGKGAAGIEGYADSGAGAGAMRTAAQVGRRKFMEMSAAQFPLKDMLVFLFKIRIRFAMHNEQVR